MLAWLLAVLDRRMFFSIQIVTTFSCMIIVSGLLKVPNFHNYG